MADAGLIAIGAGIAVGLTGLASAFAEKEIGSAAIGAMAENEKLFGKGLILTVIPEASGRRSRRSSAWIT